MTVAPSIQFVADIKIANVIALASIVTTDLAD